MLNSDMDSIQVKKKKKNPIEMMEVKQVSEGSSTPACPASPALCPVLPQPSGLLCSSPAAQHRGHHKSTRVPKINTTTGTLAR